MSNLEDIIQNYFNEYRSSEQKELEYFERTKTLELTIRRAGAAMKPSGRKYPHQKRIPRESLIQARDALLLEENQIAKCKSFHDLFHLVKSTTLPIQRIGELYAYDTAIRIGAYLRLTPKYVYLHAGTREGAKKLGLVYGREYLPKSELPAGMQELDCRELEDILCIYKDDLERLFHSGQLVD